MNKVFPKKILYPKLKKEKRGIKTFKEINYFKNKKILISIKINTFVS